MTAFEHYCIYKFPCSNNNNNSIIIISYSDHLSIDDLAEVLNIVWEVKEKWYKVGLWLDISSAELDVIERERSDPGECLREVLRVWLKTTRHTTLRKLAESLRSLEYVHVAEKLPLTTHQLRQRKSQQAPSTSPKSEHQFFPEPLPLSSIPASALEQQSSQPQLLLQGRLFVNRDILYYSTINVRLHVSMISNYR